jgi:hypothetical protein
MTFIPSPQKFRPIKARFEDREFGSEFNRWELQLLLDFSEAKKGVQTVISGTVVADWKLGRGQFILIPGPYLTQDYVLCVCPSGISVPANSSYVRVYGRRRIFGNRYEILVESIIPAKMKMPYEPEIDFKEFQDVLLIQWAGIASPLRELLAFEIVSSPPLRALSQIGGLNISLYDGTASRLSKKLLQSIGNIIPRTLERGKSCSITLPEMQVHLNLPPYAWSFKSADADKPLEESMRNLLESRKSERFSEISIGLGSDRNAPVSLYDPTVALVDQPTLLLSNAEMRKINVDPPLEVTKYLITTQMFCPTVGRTEEDFMRVLNEASSKIVEVAKSYDLASEVRRHGIFDPNSYGKPQSILRLALASARTSSQIEIDHNSTIKAFDDYYLENFKIVYEEWPNLFTSKGIEMVSLKSELERQILRFITDNETSEAGVGFHLIEEHFINQDKFKLYESVGHLLDKGKIREVKTNVFRSVPLD